MLYESIMTTVQHGPGSAKQELVRARLESMIAGLVPGEPLPPERDLARDLGVARMTLPTAARPPTVLPWRPPCRRPRHPEVRLLGAGHEQ